MFDDLGFSFEDYRVLFLKFLDEHQKRFPWTGWALNGLLVPFRISKRILLKPFFQLSLLIFMSLGSKLTEPFNLQ